MGVMPVAAAPAREHRSFRQDWSTYTRLVRYVRPYLKRLVLGTLCGIVFAGSTVSALPALKGVMREAFVDGAKDPMALALLSVVAIGLVALRGLGSFAGAYLIAWVGNRVVMDLRTQTFKHLQDLPVGYFDETTTGEMVSRVINDTMLIQHSVSIAITDLARQPFLLLGATGYLFWVNWKLAFCTLVLMPLCLWPITVFGRRVRRSIRNGQARLAEVTSIMQEAVAGIRIVKAFSMEKHELARFSATARSVFGQMMKATRASETLDPIMVTLGALAVLGAMLYGSSTGMEFDDFFTFGLALMVLYEPIKRLSRLNLQIQRSSAAADRVFEILDTENSVSERPDAVVFSGPLEDVRFENVSFTYGEGPVLDGFSLEVKAGERVAIVGPSGAGKTTLVNLLPRFYDVTGGRICINGTDIRDMTMASLRGMMGLVTQDTFLFNESIASNICYGSPGSSRELVEHAARRAHAHEFITGFPHGYDTVIGERGVRLSGGQRQRLAIARAIFRNPPILILDEATSALDTESERLVQAALNEVMEGRSVFAIAHRLSTITSCDTIIVLEDGRLTERGTHAELLAMGGTYKRLHDMQFQV